jgi:hypothetical protein
VTCWIASVPLELVVWNFNFRSDLDVRPLERFVRAIIRYCGEGPAVSDMDFISPIGVGLAATGCIGNIRLHQSLVPLPDAGIRCFPLSKIAGAHTGNQATRKTETKDDAFHPSRSCAFRRAVKAILALSIAAACLCN